jgi:hypothetical protein
MHVAAGRRSVGRIVTALDRAVAMHWDARMTLRAPLPGHTR